MTTTADVQHDIKLLTKVTIPHKAPLGENRDGLQTCAVCKYIKTQKVDLKPQETTQRDLLLAHRIYKEANARRTPSEDLNTP